MTTDNIGMTSVPELVLKPHTGWQPVDFQEIWQGRELFAFLVWRDIKIRYKQTVLGGLWALFQPFELTVRRIRFLPIRAWFFGPFLQTRCPSRATV
jgi:hypothetical protein